MTRTLISSGSPFEHQVGYSRAVVQGDWCFVAGTTGPAADGTSDGGFSFADVVRATYYITDASYWDLIGPPLGAVFGEIRPAATCIVCGLIKPEMKIEIEVTALRLKA
jgi:enamine deaminase RidA (YjgF/YER057c/UK114 family)